MKKIKYFIFILILISFQSFSFANQPKGKDGYIQTLILPMYFVNYDQILDWGGSVVFVPILFDSNFGFEPLAEVGISKNGFTSGLGGRLGFKENGYTFTLYSMANVTNVWSENNFHEVDLGWHFNPKIGLDFTCFNLEANQLIKDKIKSEPYFSIKFRITEECAQVLAVFING